MTCTTHLAVDASQFVLGPRAFLAGLYRKDSLRPCRSPLFLSTDSCGMTMRLKLHRLWESRLQCLWEGQSSQVVCADGWVMIFPPESSIQASPIYLELNVRWPVPQELPVNAPPLLPRYASALGHKIWVQDTKGQIHSLAAEDGTPTIIQGPSLDADILSGPIDFGFPDGKDGVLFATQKGLVFIDRESLRVDSELSLSMEQFDPLSVYPLPRGDLLIAERSILTGLRLSKDGWLELWRHPIKSWTNGVTHPVLLEGMVWYAAGDGQTVGLNQGAVSMRRTLQEFRPCIPRGLVQAGPGQLLLADRKGRLALFGLEDGNIKYSHLSELAGIVTDASSSVQVESIGSCDSFVAINWRTSGSSGDRWHMTLLQTNEAGFPSQYLTEELGLLIKVFDQHASSDGGATAKEEPSRR